MKTIINGVECKTQKQAVIEFLKTGKPLSQAEAYEICGSQRLGNIIYLLRKQGYRIYNLNIQEKNRFGNYMRFSKYHLSNTKREINDLENAS
tara:strand:- start:870 stop:1145 length:276 start_codon:yes stop_codon:yes gene_type:complete